MVPRCPLCGTAAREYRRVRAAAGRSLPRRRSRSFSSTVVRIFTDLRPVFGEQPTDAPIGALITHMLKLDYYTAQGMMRFT
jgi:hypothetical protein